MLTIKDDEGDNTIPFDTIQSRVGLVFCMQDYETVDMLKLLSKQYAQYLSYNDVAGIKQVQFTGNLDYYYLLDEYYGKNV